MDESLLPSPVQAEVEEPNDASRDDSTPSADEDGEVEGEDVAALEDVVPHENAVPQEVYDAVPELDIMYMPMHTYRRTRMSTITELTAESPSPPSSPAALAYTVSFSPPSSPTSASVPHRTSIGERSEPPSPSPYRLSFLTERTYSPSLRESLYDAYADSPAREGLRLSADCESLNRDGTDAARDGMSIDCERDDDPLTPATMPSSNGASLAPAHLDAGKSRESLYSAYDYSPAREAFEQPLTPATPDAPTPSAHDAFPREATNPDPALLDPRDASSQRDSLQSTSSATQTLLARPRPASAIDSLASPSHVALAHRVPIPAARGVALFVPGSARLGGEGEERDDDGPPLDSRANDEPEEEFGTVSFGASTPPRARYAHAQLYTEPDLGDGHLHQHSFSAVVHGRVREGGAPSKGKGRADSHGGEKRLPLPPTPLSPGYAGNAELAELLEEAAALEQRLVAGELPGEALRRMSMGQVMSAAPVVTVLPQRSVSANAAEPGNRSGGEGGGRPAKHTFRNPLARSRSDRKAKQPKQEAHPVASSSTNNLLATASSTGTDTGSLGRSKSSANLLPAALALPPPMPMSPAASESSVPPTPPPKSPGVNGGPRYFASLRRLASTSRALSGRGSVSTSSELSSEDSMGLITPPDEATAAPGIAWPTLSPKKSGSVGSIGRGAASLAGKMWHRTRSKSTVSTTSSFEAPLPPPSLPLPAIPKIPTLELPSSDKMPFVMPIRTDSLNQEPLSASETTPGADPFVSLSMPPSAPPAKKSPPVQTRRPNLSIGPSTALSPPSLLPMPLVPDPENRRSSWMSTSSAASSFPSSPLFDKAIFDAFPSVPEMPPAQTLGTYRRMPSHGRSSSHGRGSASGTPSPSGTVPPLPISPYSDSGSTTPVSERGAYFNAGPKVLAPTSIGRGPMLGRLYTAAETQRHVSPLP
ncbi:hypothetical protein B0H10DRAFT_2031669 [Mycena sp. CBHHK59/15]|nr:hypothetical protein B0H10DRAFT_2031669 [Mycena sp. CBHHK59/15]